MCHCMYCSLCHLIQWIYIYTYGYIIDKYSRVVVSTHEMGSCNKTHGMGLKPAHIQ